MDNYSEQIRKCKKGAAANPFQGTDRKVLFVCSMGILRSATASRIYARKYNTRSCGTYLDALIPISPLLMNWADEIVFVNEENFYAVASNPDLREGLEECTVKVLDIPDCFEHMHPQLVDAFEQQYEVIDAD